MALQRESWRSTNPDDPRDVILGLAQVVVNVPEISEAESELVAVGYQRSFAEWNLPSHPRKEPFQSTPRSALAMTYLSAPVEAPGVELTAYAGSPPGGTPAYRLAVFEPESPPQGGAMGAIADETVPGGPPSTVAYATVDAAEPEASRRFWCDGLGFEDAPGADGDLLEFPAPVPSWRMRILLRASPSSRPATTADARGCVFLTFLTTSIDAEVAELAVGDLLLRSSEPWEEQVGGRTVRVAFVEGPSGELVELLELNQAGKPGGAGDPRDQ